MALKHRRVTVIPLGADGSATAETTVNLGRGGQLVAIAIDYVDQPATTDVEVRDSDSTGTVLYAKTDSNVDVVQSPLRGPTAPIKQDGTASADTVPVAPFFRHSLYFKVSQGDGGGVDHVKFDVWYE